MRNPTLILLFLLCCSGVSAQVISVSPAYPTVDDSITIVYDAGQGNAALAGVAPVFAHTGVITDYSTDLSEWHHQVSAWDSGYDSTIVMTPLGGNLHEIRMRPRNFYGIGANENVRLLAFVMRNEMGTLAGKNADGSDMFIPIFPSNGFSAIFAAPLERPHIAAVNDNVPVQVLSNQPATLTIRLDGVQIAQSAGMVQSLSTTIPAPQTGKFYLSLEADNGTSVERDTIYYIVQGPPVVANLPGGIRDGINYVNDSTVVLSLVAPNKGYAYVIGDMTDWEMDPAYFMHKTPDGERFWLEITGLTAGQEYRFQYFVDHTVRIGDPYAEKVLDPFNDNGINNFVYPNLIDYPDGKTTELVTVMETGQTPYPWQHTNYPRPDNRDLVIYELLLRDFIIRHDYGTLIDSLDYLQGLGINAIELMPINEFDGNQSWGYGPAYYFAPDKYYGPREKLKEFIDECHARGIAVILDVVFNHAFGQNPNVRLYYDKNTDRVVPGNPWFNTDAPHPLGLGYDWNHDSWYTQQIVDSVMSFWSKEYQVDGFRLDLSKGMTNTFTGQDIGQWSQYDLSRINILKGYASRFWSHNPGKWLILEHFANNDEETELANFGYMFWGKASDPYYQAAMGYEANSDFSFAVSHQHRGWAFHNLVGFMESHDEERMMFKNISFGNATNPAHDCSDTTTAMDRMALAAAFFFTVPGPKMIWQFQEFGYDYSINWGCRTCPKPITWFYLQEARRLRLKKIYAALIHLKTGYPDTFRSGSYDISAWGKQKQIHVNSNAMDATVIGNFDVYGQDTWTGFQHTGWWYDYFSGDSLNVTDVNMTIWLEPGQYRIYTDQRLPVPDISTDELTAIQASLEEARDLEVWPNPSAGEVRMRMQLESGAPVQLRVFDLMGRTVWQGQMGDFAAGSRELTWNGRGQQGQSLPAGRYYLHVQAGEQHWTGAVVLQ